LAAFLLRGGCYDPDSGSCFDFRDEASWSLLVQVSKAGATSIVVPHGGQLVFGDEHYAIVWVGSQSYLVTVVSPSVAILGTAVWYKEEEFDVWPDTAIAAVALSPGNYLVAEAYSHDGYLTQLKVLGQ
jgi:hypothetical protein